MYKTNKMPQLIWTCKKWLAFLLQWCHNQITGVSIVCSTVCSGADHRKHQSSASLAFVRGIHRWLHGVLPSHRVSNAENICIWLCHHVLQSFEMPSYLYSNFIKGSLDDNSSSLHVLVGETKNEKPLTTWSSVLRRHMASKSAMNYN